MILRRKLGHICSRLNLVLFPVSISISEYLMPENRPTTPYTLALTLTERYQGFSLAADLFFQRATSRSSQVCAFGRHHPFIIVQFPELHADIKEGIPKTIVTSVDSSYKIILSFSSDSGTTLFGDSKSISRALVVMMGIMDGPPANDNVARTDIFFGRRVNWPWLLEGAAEKHAKSGGASFNEISM